MSTRLAWFIRNLSPASVVVLAAVLGLQGVALAQGAWPSRAIRIVVPFGPGGVPDMLARNVGERIATYIGQPVVVENRPGAGGNIGAGVVAAAEADGHTLLMTPGGVLTANASLYPQLTFDPATAFAPVSQVAEIPLVLVCAADRKASNVAELISLARTAKGGLTYASPGAGSSFHLAMESFRHVTGIAAEHIAYKSGAEAVQAVVSGQVDAMFADLPLVLQQIRAGKARALAVAGSVQLVQLPEVPTLAESNIRGVLAGSWHGLVAPAKTPKAVLEKLSDLVDRALREPELEQRFAASGVRLRPSRPDDFATFIGQQRVNTEALIRSANIRLQ